MSLALFLIMKARQGTRYYKQKSEVEKTVNKPTWLEWTVWEREQDVTLEAERASLSRWEVSESRTVQQERRKTGLPPARLPGGNKAGYWMCDTVQAEGEPEACPGEDEKQRTRTEMCWQMATGRMVMKRSTRS